MHRRPLLAMLEWYAATFPREADVAARITRLMRSRADCFERTCRPGHITAAAWILSPDRRRCLLTHHRKLNRWLQLGGHADGDWDTVEVALRESREESGIRRFDIVPIEGCVAPFDIDVHVIPERRDSTGRLIEDAHEHHDIRFLFIAASDCAIEVSDESHDVAWLAPHEIHARTQEESVLRMLRKSFAWLNA